MQKYQITLKKIISLENRNFTENTKNSNTKKISPKFYKFKKKLILFILLKQIKSKIVVFNMNERIPKIGKFNFSKKSKFK